MKKILIIEDEELLRQMYAERFEKEGFAVATASSAEEGIIAAKREQPDLIMLDILLPEGSGITFLAYKNESKEIKAIPTIAFSNFDEKTTKEQALKLGAVDYLIKTNFTPQEIVERVKEVLDSNEK